MVVRRRVKLEAAGSYELRALMSLFTKHGVHKGVFKHGVGRGVYGLGAEGLDFDNEVAYYSCIRQHSTFALRFCPQVPMHSLGFMQYCMKASMLTLDF
jgi:hypothetical protein